MQNFFMQLETGTWSGSKTLDKVRNLSDANGNPYGVWFSDSSSQKLWNQRCVVKFRLGYVAPDAEGALQSTIKDGTYSLAKNIVETQEAGEANAIQRSLYAWSIASQMFVNS